MTTTENSVNAASDVLIPPAIGSGEVLSTMLSIAVIIAAILFLGWLYSRSKFNSNNGSNAIAIVAARSLGPKDRLIVVDVGKTQLLLGLTASGMQTLHTFESPVIEESNAVAAVGFAERLKASMTGRGQ